MFVKVLYDTTGRRGFKTGPGFSCLVDGRVLFDTGDNAEFLLANMERMKVSMSKLEAVVISHEHWNRVGGLWEILGKKKGLKVYVCPKFSKELKDCITELGGKLVLADGFQKVSSGIFTTGQLGAQYRERYMAEQSLVIKGKKGTSIITGCAHPGLVRIVKHVERRFKLKKLYTVFGGFHLDGVERDKIDEIISEFKTLGVARIGPAHCAGEMATRIFRGRYGKNFVSAKAGSIIEL